MARPSTWLLLAALVLAAACTANAQRRHLLQTEGPYDDIAAAQQILEVQQEVVAEAMSASSSRSRDRTSEFIGPSTTVKPYMVPERCDVTTTSVLTVGDNIGGYRLVGIPDGLGAYRASEEEGDDDDEDDKKRGNRKMGRKSDDDDKDGDFILLANHELAADRGVERAHGGKGAFVSKWWIHSKTLRVKKGEDLIKKVFLWDWTSGTHKQEAKYAFGRFCSADLAEQSAFRWGKMGTKDRMFTNGEEIGANGRAFAHVVTGKFAGNSYQLPLFGWDSWENIVPSPTAGPDTVAIGLDDGGGLHQAVYVYVGKKKFNPNNDMNPVEAAGLLDGKLYAIKLPDLPKEDFFAMPANGRTSFSFDLVPVTPGTIIPNPTPKTFQEYVNNTERAITNFARPEDGSWDPDSPNDFYFLTTANIAGVTKMWRLRFIDIRNVELGGTASIMVNGLRGVDAIPGPPIIPAVPNQDAPVMMDNIVVHKGFTYMQEDPGNNAILARIWEYGIKSKKLEVLVRHDPALYRRGDNAARFVIEDEESSGIISLDGVSKKKGCFMIAQQTHLVLNATTTTLPTPGELVEGGQLLVMCKNARKCTN